MLFPDKYKMLNQYLKPIESLKRPILGRDNDVKRVLAALGRFEITSACLVAHPGTGKTTLMSAVKTADKRREYWEVDLALMSSPGNDGESIGTLLSYRIKSMFDEVVKYQKEVNESLVLFIDEIHTLAELSPEAFQTMKRILSDSGKLNIKLVTATTYEEFTKYIRGDEALTERMEPIRLDELSDEVTFRILRSFADSYMSGEDIPDSLLLNIINVSNKHLPSQKRPRKAIKILDAMGGWHTTFNAPMTPQLLGLVMSTNYNINVNWQYDVPKIKEVLLNRVRGQEGAVRTMIDRLLISTAGLSDPTRPQAVVLFTGPSGVGKTELAKAVSVVVSGSEESMIRFDMSEYSDERMVTVFKDRLADEIWENPSSIVLLDEIEKANPACIRLLLQVADDARLTDRYGRLVSFKDSYLLMTTNVGDDVYENLLSQTISSKKTFSAQDREELMASFMNLIRISLMEHITNGVSTFPPEFLGRLDAICPFAPLNLDIIDKIANDRLNDLRDFVYEKNMVIVHYDKRVLNYITEHRVERGRSKGGARFINNRINSDIKPKIASFLLNNNGVKDLEVIVNGKLSSEDKFDVDGNAYISVRQWKPRL